MRYAEYGDAIERGPMRRLFASLLRGSRWQYRWHRIRRRFGRVERWPDDGVDYTGSEARMLHAVGQIPAGKQGRVMGFQSQRQGKLWTVRFLGVGDFEETDYLTTLPDPETLELTASAA